MRLSSITTALALSGLVSAVPTALEPRQVTTGINAAIVAKGKKYVGTALTMRGDNTEMGIIGNANEIGCVTPENAMKWDATEPSRGSFSFSGADQIANYATQNNKQLRCHTLVWYSQLPSWVSNSGFNNATLISVMQNHITTLMTRYKGKCTHWDVVNEALNEDGTYRSNVFLSVIGEAYIPIAFRAAAAADPNAKLYYNDYNLEYAGAKMQGAVRIVKLVQSYGVKIDGVGFQGHLVVEPTSSQSVITPPVDTLVQALSNMTTLGVDVAYTELDIRMPMPSTSTKLSEQADCYTRVVQSCMQVPRCVGLTLWGISDKYSWVPNTFSSEGAALLWDSNFAKKPAYTAFLNAINAANATTSS